MQLSDLDEVLEIEAYSFPSPWDRQTYERDLMLNEHSRFYIALDDNNELAGYIGNWFILDECHVGTVAVKREYRRMGIAHLLLAHTARLALSEGVTYIILEVRVSNTAAVELYEALGFNIVGRRRGYYQDTGEDAHLMLMNDLPKLIECVELELKRSRG